MQWKTWECSLLFLMNCTANMDGAVFVYLHNGTTISGTIQFASKVTFEGLAEIVRMLHIMYTVEHNTMKSF